ncbi:hypothetical protein K440DRAFT_662010 [Wilcoxina mikolae CBS 423.85]|nr:hypothetical protein K440DRAFT_662010 [Wilcoxina mikolae CBS 423.85]
MAKYPTGNVNFASMTEDVNTTSVRALVTPKQHHCNLCDQAFNTKSALRAHVKMSARHKELFGCKFCGKALRDQSALNSHLWSQHDFKNPKGSAGHVSVPTMRQNSPIPVHPKVKAVPKPTTSTPTSKQPGLRLPLWTATPCRHCDVLVNKQDWHNHKKSQAHLDSCERKTMLTRSSQSRPRHDSITSQHPLHWIPLTDRWITLSNESSNETSSQTPVKIEQQPHSRARGAAKYKTNRRNIAVAPPKANYCKLCDVEYFGSLETHKKTHTDRAEGDGQQYCEDCLQAFKSEKAFMDHNRRMHDLSATTKTAVKSGHVNLRRGSFYGV